MNEKVKHLRQEYAHSTLDDGAIELNPFYQFKKWFEEALSAELPEPHAMNLATVSENGRPSFLPIMKVKKVAICLKIRR